MSEIYNGQLDAFDLYHLYSEERRKRTSVSGGGQALPALGHALAGAVGSAISNLAVYPLALIVTRLQSQRQLQKKAQTSSSSSQSPSVDGGTGAEARYASIQDAFRRIVADEGGIPALYAGVSADTAKSVADAFLFFLAYNILRQSRLFRLDSTRGLSVLNELSVGFVAGAFSKLITSPISNVVTRMQTSSMAGGPKGPRRSLTAAGVARQIRAEKGIRGFWAGYSASLVLTLNPSLTFFFFDTFKTAVLGARSGNKNPKAWVTFLLAAVSKALASSVTYPFQLAKARIQVASKGKGEDRHEEGGASALEKDDHSASGAAKASASAAAAKARQETVFSTVADVARSEGLLALYEGWSGEVLKGFVSHGITMMAKDMVHGLVVGLYFALLRLLRRHPEAQQAVEKVQSRVQSQVQSAVEATKDGAETVRKKVA